MLCLMKTTTKTVSVDAAKTAMAAAAAKAGANLGELDIRFLTIEATWGDLAGFVVLGGDETIRTRAAAWLHAWLGRNMPERSYAAQYARRDPRPVGVHARTGKVGDQAKPDMLPGVAVPFVYYPGDE